jgi:hypothetical protein
MRKLLLLTLVVLLSVPAFSQIKFGLKAGIGSTTVPTYNIASGTNNIEAVKSADIGFHFGAFLRLSLLGIYLQPELIFASNKYDYNVTTVSGTDPLSQTYNRLQIPVLVGFKLGPLRINAGPAASIQIGSPSALINSANYSEMYKGATFGYQAGVGFDLFKKLTFDVRYAGNLSGKFGESVTIGTQNFKLDSAQPSVLLSVGLMF